ncbi:MAG: response regulator [Deltaproteobacteria bacterium]|nr:response regulator [Deltaproteobacteria bacterium]
MQTLLVAEDDPVMHAALSELLRLEGYDVVGARRVEDARAMLGNPAIDGALIDWQLGDERTDPLLAELVEMGIATILLSAHPEARAIADALGIPCVHKPFVVEQLLGILSGAISRRTLRRIALSRG